jgi:hypothetical protein
VDAQEVIVGVINGLLVLACTTLPIALVVWLLGRRRGRVRSSPPPATAFGPPSYLAPPPRTGPSGSPTPLAPTWWLAADGLWYPPAAPSTGP